MFDPYIATISDLDREDQTDEPNLSPTRSLIWASDSFLTSDKAGHLRSMWVRSSESSRHNGHVFSILYWLNLALVD